MTRRVMAVDSSQTRYRPAMTRSTTDRPPTKLAVLGGGNMAEAIVRGLIGRYAVTVADPSPERRAVMADLARGEITVEAVEDLRPNLDDADLLLIAVKPNVAPDVLPTVRNGRALVVSIMAGVPTAKIDALLGGGRRVVRVMPNTPVMVGRGVCGVCRGGTRQRSATRSWPPTSSSPRPTSSRCPEALMDAVTAVSGSGPAYVFYLVEHLAAAAEAVGLPPDQAAVMARETIRGAAEMLDGQDTPPSELRRRVTSPGGTTQAAIETFDAHGTPAAIRAAVTAARDRGRELAGG